MSDGQFLILEDIDRATLSDCSLLFTEIEDLLCLNRV